MSTGTSTATAGRSATRQRGRRAHCPTGSHARATDLTIGRGTPAAASFRDEPIRLLVRVKRQHRRQTSTRASATRNLRSATTSPRAAQSAARTATPRRFSPANPLVGRRSRNRYGRFRPSRVQIPPPPVLAQLFTSGSSRANVRWVWSRLWSFSGEKTSVVSGRGELAPGAGHRPAARASGSPRTPRSTNTRRSPGRAPPAPGS
jgi:hypothetical protein